MCNANNILSVCALWIMDYGMDYPTYVHHTALALTPVL